MMGTPQEHRRHQAIARYLAGDPIEAICRELHCAKSWLYKWTARYQADDPGWATGRSTQPRRQPRQTPQLIAEHVSTLRRTLAQSGAQESAAAIQQGLKQQGVEPIPSLRTIYRLLQRHAEKEDISHHPGLAAVHDLVVLLKGPRGHGTQSRRPSIVHSISTPGGHCHEQGKTWLACALGHQACRAGWTVLYLRLPRLLQEFPLAKGDGRYVKLMTALAKTDVLILD